MAVAWHVQPNLGAENSWVFDACSDSAVKDEEGVFPLCLLEYSDKLKEKHLFLGAWESRNSDPPFLHPC